MTGTVDARRFLELIRGRRSIRRYLDSPVPGELIDQILECGLHAPNGGGLQSSRFYVIQNPERMNRLNDAIREGLRNRTIVEGSSVNKGILRARQEGYHFCYRAPVLITAAAPAVYDNRMADCSVALENMLLACHALGLGACWCNQPHWLTDDELVRKIFREIGMPDTEEICGSICLGYTENESKGKAPRKDNRIIKDTV